MPGAFANRFVVFNDILVQPTRLPPQGGMPAHGGPAFPADAPTFVHQCRGGRLLRAPPPVSTEGAAAAAILPGTYLFAGPIWRHFGHMMGEFVHRLWVSDLPGMAGAAALFTCTDGRPVPGFVPQALALLGIGAATYVDRPVRVERLVVGEPGKMLGSVAAPDYVAWLSRRLAHRRPAADAAPRLAVMRGHLPRGRWLWEAWFEQRLAAAGYLLFRPEEHSLEEQARTYLGARQIIFSEGSALHLLDILPPLAAEVAVICRRPEHSMAADTLAGKCRRFVEFRAVTPLHDPTGHVLPANAIGVLRPSELGGWLEAEGFLPRGSRTGRPAPADLPSLIGDLLAVTQRAPKRNQSLADPREDEAALRDALSRLMLTLL